MAMALNLQMLIMPPIYRTIEEGKACLMVNNRATYQRQSWIPDTPTGEQAIFILTTRDKKCPVPVIIEEHKFYFNLHIISLMFNVGCRRLYYLGLSIRSTKHA